jgi:hypothetical protein
MISNEAVKARTGKDWDTWFKLLDRAGGQKLGHPATVELLIKKHAVPGWWAQCLTVEYERARGLRERHQTAAGYSVGVTRTISSGLGNLYEATSNASLRRKWFPRGAFEVSSQTRDKYFRGPWKKTARLEVGFYAKGPGRAQIALQVSRLANRSEVETTRETWKKALGKLQTLLEK